ncbi:tRNA(Met) cytidine acetyltransferase [Marinomonas agarivorans]|nr:tRNA(Met) cytidine acetyltransferase [Marinomonas agarivorans]
MASKQTSAQPLLTHGIASATPISNEYTNHSPSKKHRYFYLLIGTAEERIHAFQTLAKNLHNPTVITLQPENYQAKQQLTDNNLSCLAFNQLNQTLGLTYEALLFDMEQGVSANSLAIAAGTVCGGGIFAIGMPDINTWLTLPDHDMARYLPWPLALKETPKKAPKEVPEEQTSYFKHYLAQHLQRLTPQKMLLPQPPAMLKPVPRLPTLESEQAIQLNHEQAQVLADLLRQIQTLTTQVQTLTAQVPRQSQAIFMTAHRGRGKSSLLGILLATLLNNGIKAAVTAPRKKALQALNYHFKKTLTSKEATLPFYAPDALLHSPEPIEVLVIDEAAALPITMLEGFAQQYPFVIFSSTDHGYESGGKGFGLRLADLLQKQGINVAQYNLTIPVRWQEGDYLESWLNDLLFLYAETTPQLPMTQSEDEQADEQTDEKVIQHYQGRQWLTQFDKLPALFHLLINAHYQTAPNDIRWILDDASTCTWLLKDVSQEKSENEGNNQQASTQLKAAAIVTEEGPIEPKMAQAVLEGRRRPRGHLLPQSLLAHEGHKDAAQFRYWRVSRIATQANCRRQGFASQLLTQIEQAAMQQHIDFLCTSFAATTDTLLFWQKNGFQCVRLGTAKDQASGCYSVMMIKGLNKIAQQVGLEWHENYLANLTINLPLDYQTLDDELKALLLQSNSTPSNMMTAKDRADLLLFCQHSRPYLTIRAQLNRFINCLIQQGLLDPNHVHYDFFTQLIQTSSHTMTYSDFGLTSRKIVENHIRHGVAELLALVAH